MPILTLQQRQRELGRIRLGHRVGKNGRPEKLDRFRVTSASKAIVESVAAQYGGTVEAWNDQWQVITEARDMPILVPPQPVSQFFELWSGGGCQRRCDGMTELLTDSACMCDPDPERRECKPTTRLNVVLRDVHGVGVFRLETHGYYAATELPQTAAFLASATGQGVYLPARLSLEERTVTKVGQPTKKFVVPIIEVEVTPAQLMAGGGGAVGIGAGDGQAVSAGQPQAIEAARSTADWMALVDGVSTLEEWRGLWRDAAAAHVSPAVAGALKTKGELLRPAETAVESSDPDELWQRIVGACPPGWSLDDLEVDFTRWSEGTSPGAAKPVQLQGYLAKLTGASV